MMEVYLVYTFLAQTHLFFIFLFVYICIFEVFKYHIKYL